MSEILAELTNINKTFSRWFFLSVPRETYKKSKENVLRRLRNETKWLESTEHDAQTSSDEVVWE